MATKLTADALTLAEHGPPDNLLDRPWPQQGRERLIIPAPVAVLGTDMSTGEHDALARLSPDTVMMMGDNPALPRMPTAPTLMDFFRYRVGGITGRHLISSAKRALDEGQPEKIVLACLLHDFANVGLIRGDHGYWGAQMIAPYVDEEVAFAVKYHQALRYVADDSVGYAYPESYHRFFGPDYVPEDYILRDADYARQHRWYMSARIVTLNDLYFFEETDDQPDAEIFTDIIGRHFRQPAEGLGFDGSPVAHMWRTLIWPNNFL